MSVCYNGTFYPDKSPLFAADNRAFRYGDGFFETIRCAMGVPLWWEQHYQRMQRTAKMLRMEMPDAHHQAYFFDKISELLISNQHIEGARVRLAVFRKSGGLYKPTDNGVSFLMESNPLIDPVYRLNKTGLMMGKYPDLFKTYNQLSELKTSNALIYVLAGRYAQEKGWDDCVILNDHAQVAEATSSNIFMVKSNRLFTPSLDQGCVAGVMRAVLMQVAKQHNIKIEDCTLEYADLLDADEVFLTNAVSGIQWVKGLDHKRYFHKMAASILDLINDKHQAMR